jgi:hypothetical protein
MEARLNMVALLAFVGAGSMSLWQLYPGTHRRQGNWLANPEAYAVHAVMNLAMALMVTSFYPSLFVPVLVALGLTIAVLALRLVATLSSRKKDGARGQGQPITASIYHILSCSVMLWAAAAMPPAMNAMQTLEVAPAHSAGRVILASLFAVDALLTIGYVVLIPRPLVGWASTSRLLGPMVDVDETVSQLRLSALPHIVMDSGMALMLLGRLGP